MAWRTPISRRTRPTLMPTQPVVWNCRRCLAASVANNRELKSREDIENYLSEPSWSVKSLLPTEEHIKNTPVITPERLRHLLRLSALPPPSSAEEEVKMINDLRSQLHFVKEIQKVDTTGVEPLRSIRDETETGQKQLEITMETLKDAFAQEEIIGKRYQRIRRKGRPKGTNEAENWDVVRQAQKTVGRYIIVEGPEASPSGGKG